MNDTHLNPIKDALSGVIGPLLDNPELFNLELSVAPNSVLIQVVCASHDIGKVVGRGGATFKALYLLGSAISAKHGKRLNLLILE